MHTIFSSHSSFSKRFLVLRTIPANQPTSNPPSSFHKQHYKQQALQKAHFLSNSEETGLGYNQEGTLGKLNHCWVNFSPVLTHAATHALTQLKTRTQIPAASSPYTAMCESRWCSGLSLHPCNFRPLGPRVESWMERIFLLKINNVA